VGAWESEWVDYYEELGVSPKATQNVIKAAYRAMARDFHPDKSSTDTERMKRINAADEVLSDPEHRRRYDIAYEARKQASEDEARRKAAADDHTRSATESTPTSSSTQPQSFSRPLLVWGGVLVVLAVLWVGMSDENGTDDETDRPYVFPTWTTDYSSYWIPPTPVWRPATSTSTPFWRPPATAAPFWIPPTAVPRSTVVAPAREETMASRATATARAEVQATKDTIQNEAALARAYERMETAAQNNRWSIAVDEADRILVEQPDYRDVGEKRPGYFDRLYEAAITAYNGERWDEAVKLLSQLKRLEPSNADVRQMANAAEREARKHR
jgi:DnaJ-domain-containing protein 1